VVSLGVGAEFRRRDQRELHIGLEKFALSPGTYGLCVSALEPRKKIPQLLAAWRRLPKRVRDVHRLVLAGGSGWMNEQLHSQIADAKREGCGTRAKRHRYVLCEGRRSLLALQRPYAHADRFGWRRHPRWGRTRRSGSSAASAASASTAAPGDADLSGRQRYPGDGYVSGSASSTTAASAAGGAWRARLSVAKHDQARGRPAGRPLILSRQRPIPK